MESVLDAVGNFIKEVGFPIAACLYLALRFEKILKENTSATQEMLEFWQSKNGKL